MLLSSCTTLLTGSVIEPAVGNLQRQRDIELVCEGAPAYLLMIDSLTESDPDSRRMLLLAAKSYSGTIAALESCGAPASRLQALSEKAGDYGKRLLLSLVPNLLANPIDSSLEQELATLDIHVAPYLFWGASGWLAWVRQQNGSPAAMADLPLIEKLMARVLELDETVENGGAHLFFGVLFGSKPAIAGGDQEKSKAHFERALVLSGRSLLMIQTLYAQTYARMALDKTLHDRLLREVLDFSVEKAPDMVLANMIAKRRAHRLLEENYFPE